MADVKIGKICLGQMQTNCYFVYREGVNEAMVIDPGSSGKHLYEKLTEHGFSVKRILLTHGHFDHIGGVDALRKASGAKVYALEPEKVLLQDPYVNVSAQMHAKVTVEADGFLQDGEELEYGGKKCKVIATPGHTIGGCCFYFEEAGMVICGDTIFAESVGRTDFPTGNMKKLLASIEDKIFTLPEDTKLYPGHGPATTVGHEKENNPCFN